jgi:hypothetical protein
MDNEIQPYIDRAWAAATSNLYAAIVGPDGTVVFSPAGFGSLQRVLSRPRDPAPRDRLVLQEQAQPLTTLTLCVDQGAALHLWSTSLEHWEGATVVAAAPAPLFLATELALAHAVGACATSNSGRVNVRLVDSAVTALGAVLSSGLGAAGAARGQALALGLAPDHAALRHLRHVAARVGSRPEEAWKAAASVGASVLNIASALDALRAATIAHLVADHGRSLTDEWPQLIDEVVTRQIADLARVIDGACAEAFDAAHRQGDEAALRAIELLDRYSVKSDRGANDNRQ